MKQRFSFKYNIRAVSLLTLAGALLLAGCSTFQPIKSSSISTYTLEAQFPSHATTKGELTLLVSTPNASAGFDTPRMRYIKKQHELDYFSQNQWIDTPARMLAPILLQALESTAQYRSVVSARTAAKADLRLDTEIIRLQHDFIPRPSQVRITIRAQLIDMRNKSVLATREFDVTEIATSEDPYGGVLAYNRAVKTILLQIAEFCVPLSNAEK